MPAGRRSTAEKSKTRTEEQLCYKSSYEKSKFDINLINVRGNNASFKFILINTKKGAQYNVGLIDAKICTVTYLI